jgi:prepilin-type N-terminal cleavage/methylation domain-containing protein
MRRNEGFTLTEMAVVLAIFALLVGGLMMPLAMQQDNKNRQDTTKALAEIREALIGYALLNKKLPCPASTAITDPANASYGVAAASCSPGSEGYLPWKTLGVREVDAWGSPRTGASDPFVGYWKYRVDKNFASTITVTTSLGDTILVKDHAGNQLTLSTETPVAVVYSTGANRAADGLNGDATADVYESGEVINNSGQFSATFDDMLIWISRPLLISRLVAAGVL